MTGGARISKPCRGLVTIGVLVRMVFIADDEFPSLSAYTAKAERLVKQWTGKVYPGIEGPLDIEVSGLYSHVRPSQTWPEPDPGSVESGWTLSKPNSLFDPSRLSCGVCGEQAVRLWVRYDGRVAPTCAKHGPEDKV